MADKSPCGRCPLSGLQQEQRYCPWLLQRKLLCLLSLLQWADKEQGPYFIGFPEEPTTCPYRNSGGAGSQSA